MDLAAFLVCHEDYTNNSYNVLEWVWNCLLHRSFVNWTYTYITFCYT